MAAPLPDFPWDSLASSAAVARRHPDGLVDLSVGSPVDPTPQSIRLAAAAAMDAHGYPTVAGTPELRAAIAAWFARRRRVPALDADQVLPTIGSKELVASLPLHLGLGPGDTVVQPTLAYPTYAVGAALAGADVVAADDPDRWPEGTRLVWLNSPGNPDGRVLGVEALARAVHRAREIDAVIVSDECYAELDWTGAGTTPSILDPRVTGGSPGGVLAVCSLSKQSNLAGYRAGFVAGCARLIGRIREVRRHAGLMPPSPVQQAMIAALGDDRHVAEQKERYRLRRDRLAGALRLAGFDLDGGSGGLYLWATRREPAWTSVARLAEHGILVAPGTFYGAAGDRHIRVALTATDERVDAAARRLADYSTS